MTDGSPESDTWLRSLIERSPVLPERCLRQHWGHVVPWLPNQARYELAAVLLEIEHAVRQAP